ncbi:MAG: AzlC family ABC transporter permease [Phyllobacterium sp.]
MPDSASIDVESSTESRTAWYFRGMARLTSVPALILMTTFVGFAGLAKESGITVWQAVFMTGVIWALPAKVVLIGSINAGYSLPATALAVSLSSVRLMPMVMAIVPEIRAARTKKLTLLLLSHFVAVTAWVMALERFSRVPRDMRISYFAGIGSSLVLANMIVVAVVYIVSAGFPPLLFAALFFLTPMYFLTSLWGSARDRSVHVAMVSGLVLLPVFHEMVPGYDLLLTGAVGGLIAYLYAGWSRKWME